MQNIFNFIGDKNKFPGDRSRLVSGASNNRTGSVTNKITMTTGSVATAVRMSIGMGVERSRRLRHIFNPEPQAQRHSDTWCTYGNSIGTGAIIKALPPDNYGKKKKEEVKVNSGSDGTYRMLGGVPAGNFFYKNQAVPRSIIAPSQWSKNK